MRIGKKYRLFSLLIISSIHFTCQSKISSYRVEKNIPLKLYLEPTQVGIDIFFLHSIHSSTIQGISQKDLISFITKKHAQWFDIRLRKILNANGILIVAKDKAEFILEPIIVDMGEIRPKVFLQGLSIGLLFGLIIGEATGKPDIGLAVFAWEVLEEMIIVYLLKSIFMITTIELNIKSGSGALLTSKEFTSYSNEDFENSLPEFTRKLRENKVRGSLEKNASKISDFLLE